MDSLSKGMGPDGPTLGWVRHEYLIMNRRRFMPFGCKAALLRIK